MPKRRDGTMTLTKVQAGRLGGLARSALHDGRAMTSAARSSFAASFLSGHQCIACPRIEIRTICR